MGMGLVTMCSLGSAGAQQAEPQKEKPTEQAKEKPTWKGPFGGTFTATIAGVTDYSYRGISQTQRQAALQPSFGYETAPFAESVPVSAYIGAWGSNVNFPNTGASPEIDLSAGFRAKALNEKLTVDLGYIRYNYVGADSLLQLDFNEYGLVVGYDFGPVALSGAVRYSPQFFANTGHAWYKWAQAVVPLSFIRVNDDISFKAFGTLGTQYVERNLAYGISRNDYWDWQVGITATVYGVDLTLAYTDTSVHGVDWGNTANCDARAIFMISKTF